jgi:glycosyltransferase involved in cell wall biosynthesis
VEVLTGFPHYPGNALYDGYKMRFVQHETIDGISVVRVPLYPSHGSSSLKRILCYTSFALSASTLGMLFAKRADVIVIGEGPGTMGLAGCIGKLLRRTPFVIYVLDCWPETLEGTGMLSSKLALSLVGKMMDSIYGRAARVIASTPGYKHAIESRGIPPQKVDLVYGWCEDTSFVMSAPDPSLKREIGMGDQFNIVYAGNIGKAQALSSVVRAAEIVKTKCPDVLFWLIGDGVDVDHLKDLVKTLNLMNVKFLPRQAINQVGKILRLADVLLVHLKDDSSYKITIPSKTVASMATGRPLLVAVGGDTADLVDKAGAGVNCRPEDPQSIAEGVIRMRGMSKCKLEMMGRAGRDYYLNNMSGSIAVLQFERIFEEVLADAASTSKRTARAG